MQLGMEGETDYKVKMGVVLIFILETAYETGPLCCAIIDTAARVLLVFLFV